MNVRTVGSAGDILVGGAFSATDGITVSSMQGTLNIAGAMTAGEVEIQGSLSGAIELEGGMSAGTLDLWDSVSGDILVDGDVGTNAVIDIAHHLNAGGSIVVSGIMNGGIEVGRATVKYSLIHLLGGIDDDGVVTINNSQDDWNAAGDIHVGPFSYITPPDITYDGCIQILDNNCGEPQCEPYGDLYGDVTVVGCHATSDPLALHAEGTTYGTLEIDQPGCDPQAAGWTDTCP